MACLKQMCTRHFRKLGFPSWLYMQKGSPIEADNKFIQVPIFHNFYGGQYMVYVLRKGSRVKRGSTQLFSRINITVGTKQ